MLSSGGLTATVVDVRMILKSALLCNADQLIIAHNHPAGSMRASEPDILLTRQVRDAAALMNMKLVDHIIVAGNSFISLADEGMI